MIDLLWDELNVLKRNLNVKTKNTIDDYRFKSSVHYKNVRLWTSGRTHRFPKKIPLFSVLSLFLSLNIIQKAIED